MTEEPADHPEPLATTDGAPAPVRRSSSAQWALGGLAAVFLATTVLFGILAVGYKSDLDEAVDERSDVAATAGELMQATLAFDYRDPEGSVAAVLTNASGQFAADFEEASEAITEGFAAVEAVPTAVIRDVFVSDIAAEGTAVAIVFYDQFIEGAAGTSAFDDCYARLQLARGPEGWTVNSVENLAGCGRTELDPPSGAPSTTVTP